MRILNVANNYNVRPSTILHVDDEYTAYCIDEAFSYVKSEISKLEEPFMEKETKKQSKLEHAQQFDTVEDFFNQLGVEYK